MDIVQQTHVALIEGRTHFSGSDAEYWSRVRTDSHGPYIVMVLRVAERCNVCKRSKCVYIVRAEIAQCHDCDGDFNKPVAQADGLPSADDLDIVCLESRIAEETA